MQTKRSVWGFNCWKCKTYLDVEEVLFKNQCWVCGASQGQGDNWRW